MVSPKTTNVPEFRGLPLTPLGPAPSGRGPGWLGRVCSPSSGAGPAPPGWRSWWPWSYSAPPLCCTAWRSGSHSLPSAQPTPSPNETALQPGWDTGPGQAPPQSPRLSRKHSHKDKTSEWPGRNKARQEQVSIEEWVLQPLHCKP